MQIMNKSKFTLHTVTDTIEVETTVSAL